MKKLFLFTLLCSFFQFAFSQNMPFPQNKVYSFGLMPTNRSGSDAQSAYNTWKTNFVEGCANGRYRVRFDDRSQTVSEGIGYGMLLAAYAGDKTVFDGLWNYYKDNRNGHGVMNWKIGGCSGTVGSNGATDAEEDAAMALIVAHYQWGSTGNINYSNDAKALISAIKNYEVESGSFVLKPGDMFGGSSLTNPSYFAPGYYRAYGEFTNDASFWNSVASKAYSVINGNLSKHSAAGGLVSDWCTGDGSYSSSASGYYSQGQRYHYDACRTPWRIAVDYAWYGTSDAQSYSQKTSDFVRVNLGGSRNVKDGYNQNGSAYGQYHNSAFVGGFASASIGGGNQTHVNDSYTDLKGLNDANSYFNQTLKTLYLFFLTGNFYKPGSSTPTPVNNAPTVSITSPANGSSFTAPASVTIQANATDSDGSISKVEFFQGTTKLGEDLTAPYSFTWSNVASGTYAITAKATDNGSAVTTSATVNITVNNAPVSNNAPTASISSPGNGASFTAPATITIQANATDSDGSISKVEFYQGTTKLGEDLSAPYSFTWNNVNAGNYSLTVKATDNSAAVTTSAAVNISVTTAPTTNIAPSVSITSPVSGSSFTAPASVTIQANATDSDGSISKVEFFQGTTKLGEDLSSPYSFSWTNVAAGTYSITAKATDNSGAATTSAAVSITVNNSTTPSPGTCTTAAIPAAANYSVRNNWSDQNNGSGVSNTASALQITHRQWGNSYLWVIQSGSTTQLTAGKEYTITFDFQDDPNNRLTSLEVGYASSFDLSGATLVQPTVLAPAGFSATSFTTKSVKIKAAASGTAYLVFKLNWTSQPNMQVNTFLKNLSVCESASTVRTGTIANTESTMNVYPNPFNDHTPLVIRAAEDKEVLVRVTDMNGIIVHEGYHNTNEQIKLSDAIKSGIYLIQVISEEDQQTFRLMKN